MPPRRAPGTVAELVPLMLRKPVVKRMARRAGIVRIDRTLYPAVHQFAEQTMESILRDAVILAAGGKRRRVTVRDMAMALANNGIKLYGYGDINPEDVRTKFPDDNKKNNVNQGQVPAPVHHSPALSHHSPAPSHHSMPHQSNHPSPHQSSASSSSHHSVASFHSQRAQSVRSAASSRHSSAPRASSSSSSFSGFDDSAIQHAADLLQPRRSTTSSTRSATSSSRHSSAPRASSSFSGFGDSAIQHAADLLQPRRSTTSSSSRHSSAHASAHHTPAPSVRSSTSSTSRRSAHHSPVASAAASAAAAGAAAAADDDDENVQTLEDLVGPASAAAMRRINSLPKKQNRVQRVEALLAKHPAIAKTNIGKVRREVAANADRVDAELAERIKNAGLRVMTSMLTKKDLDILRSEDFCLRKTKGGKFGKGTWLYTEEAQMLELQNMRQRPNMRSCKFFSTAADGSQQLDGFVYYRVTGDGSHSSATADQVTGPVSLVKLVSVMNSDKLRMGQLPTVGPNYMVDLRDHRVEFETDDPNNTDPFPVSDNQNRDGVIWPHNGMFQFGPFVEILAMCARKGSACSAKFMIDYVVDNALNNTGADFMHRYDTVFLIMEASADAAKLLRDHLDMYQSRLKISKLNERGRAVGTPFFMRGLTDSKGKDFNTLMFCRYWPKSPKPMDEYYRGKRPQVDTAAQAAKRQADLEKEVEESRAAEEEWRRKYRS